ncbi:MAG: hydantoinase/oxoprolinase family protein [Gammaproteobacteria bacterium]|jgi:N-methylhydantoinase A|nr:hydantoinase/oxoprolinase family protein [Gammaproteobacteria bacterium]MBT6074024.1 hydantoinase/oxoprolinase family protein [Gammaproteobacteria bacterium]MBT7754449.1 hydantoinase/oxoprolinase family protein [Gammaproteobacteria bacterium]
MSYRLGVDVGGTFTDLLLVNEKTGELHTAKVPSTPDDSSRGVFNGIHRVCKNADIQPGEITSVMHGTTVATNTILTGTGAKVGLITTKGYRQVLQIARSFVPGGLGGWVIYNKSDPIAPLALTIEADERMSSKGEVISSLKVGKLAKDIKELSKKGIEAVTVSLINSFANDKHEKEIRAQIKKKKLLPKIPVSLSSEVVPEMQEYERTITTVANSYVRPKVAEYVKNLQNGLKKMRKDIKLQILRSDGGLASAKASSDSPVSLLMSGPAGGVSGAIWIAKQAGYENLLTFDMGGTSTDVSLVKDGKAEQSRETSVGDVTVRASSVDVRTVGAGGGSIAHVPELTGALRVGPQSAGAEPGPAAYNKGGTEPTVTDANVVLGYMPSGVELGGDSEWKIRKDLAQESVKSVAKALGLSINKAAAGIIDIVNENMYGALRLVSVEKGYDPREFALIGFGGAGPLHANALGKLINSWPVIIPPGPGVLCAYGDVTTNIQDESSMSFIRKFKDTTKEEVVNIFTNLEKKASKSLDAENSPKKNRTTSFQVDIRYHGQGLTITVDFDLSDLKKKGLNAIGDKFDEQHEQLFTFSLDAEKELVNLRAVVKDKALSIKAPSVGRGSKEPTKKSIIDDNATVFMEGKNQIAKIYRRSLLKQGNVVKGPAIVTEMDSTTLILSGHNGQIDKFGNILINPDA